MPRPKINTHTLDAAERRMLVELFGTPKHAYETLRLSDVGVEFPSFQRVWAGDTAPEKAVDIVVEHFAMWRADFLKEMKSASYKLDLESWAEGSKSL